MRSFKLALVAVLAAVTLAACGGGGGGGGDSAQSPANGATGAPSAAPSEVESSEPGVITITAPANASTTGFAETQVTATADTAFTIHFDNQDPGIPHNIVIYAGTEATGTPVFTPGATTYVTGPDTDDYDIPALAAGTYTFVCAVHPTVMFGTLTVA